MSVEQVNRVKAFKLTRGTVTFAKQTMGNYISRRAAYSTKEGRRCETPQQTYEDITHRVLRLDPRSPTAEIVRTPIQVSMNDKIVSDTPKQSCLPSNDWDTPTSVFSTKAMRSSDVDLPSLGDLDEPDVSCPHQSSGSDEFEEMIAELADIEKSYKSTSASYTQVEREAPKEMAKKMPIQKLQFSPEKESIPKSIPKKARNPLSARSTNTHVAVNSPSSYLRLKQQNSINVSAFQKFPLKHSNGFNCENTPPKAMVKAATLPRRRPAVEWDKDATMII